MNNRRKSKKIFVGGVAVGGDAPISIQSMTSTPTKDIASTVKEIIRLQDAGCDIVRVGVLDLESARAISDIKKEVKIPIVADIHFDYRLAIEAVKAGADGLRLNPGNIRNKENIRKVVFACKEKGIPIRVGVNAGSIDRKKYPYVTPGALVDSAWEHIRILEEMDFTDIKVSLKASDVNVMIEAYRMFASQCEYPLHLGVTEAGTYKESMVKSSIGIGSLLYDGIGDTIRVSVTGDVVEEVEIAKLILRSLGLRKEGIEIISCPTCGRKEFDVESVVKELEEKTKGFKKYLKVAVMGCVVNGPGEAKEADLGIVAGKNEAILLEKGRVIRKVDKAKIIDLLIDKIKERM
jgi:(E)-4-hydroxy-3-methylbut-2-enyl-diphosphate synthase